jgi:hypothetical protein
MSSIPEQALSYASLYKLDLDVHKEMIPLEPFVFNCLTPRKEIVASFKKAKRAKLPWPDGMPVPVVTFNRKRHEWAIMDGMTRICAAKMTGFNQIPALVASGETHDELHHILQYGYYGEDFVEMLAAVNPLVLNNLQNRDDMRLAGK